MGSSEAADEGVQTFRTTAQTESANSLFLKEDTDEDLNVVESQPIREAPYYYGDIIRSRKLDLPTIFPESSKRQRRRELISILNVNDTGLSVETVTLDKKHSSLPKRHLKVPDHIMDGIRVQLKNAGTRLKGAASTNTTPQRLRHQRVIRSQESHVSLRGWLYRLEGGTLKQWKRRWCVLADYCLFYYKGKFTFFFFHLFLL